MAKRPQDLDFHSFPTFAQAPLETYSLKQCEHQTRQKHFPLYVHTGNYISFPTEKEET